MLKPLLTALAFTLMATTTQAAMEFEPVKDEGGIMFIRVSGVFEATDDVLPLRDLVQKTNIHVLSFSSIGGNVAKAMELGRLIRSLDMVTAQGLVGDCASACAFAFMGGAVRMADPGTIGIHKMALAAGSKLSAPEAASTVQDTILSLIAYFNEMGVDPALLSVMLQYGSDDMRYLSKSEMTQYKLTNYNDFKVDQSSVQLPAEAQGTEPPVPYPPVPYPPVPAMRPKQ